MQFWLNEKSLNQQFRSIQEFKEAIIAMNAIFSFIEEKRKNDTFFQDSLLFKADYQAIIAEDFQVSFGKLNPQLQVAFKKYLNEGVKAINWRAERLHNDRDYFYCKILQDVVTDTTLAEVAERNLQGSTENIVVNFIKSSYQDSKEIDIFKDDLECSNPIKISCIENINGFEEKLSEQSIDYEAFLKNTLLFKKLNYQVQGKTIYQHLENGQYWYLDNFHKTSRHFEVFNKLREHLGEADLEGNINYSKADSSKNQKLPM